jgi:hypothetical protein
MSQLLDTYTPTDSLLIPCAVHMGYYRQRRLSRSQFRAHVIKTPPSAVTQRERKSVLGIITRPQ